MTAILTDRFWSKVDKLDDGCWLWTGACNSTGYGQWGVNGRSRSVHRVAYEALVGPIPDGLTIDHLCRVRPCCNPEHLEPVTIAENTARAHEHRTTCRHGAEVIYRKNRVHRRDCAECVVAEAESARFYHELFEAAFAGMTRRAS
jgi:hypothetical protein